MRDETDLRAKKQFTPIGSVRTLCDCSLVVSISNTVWIFVQKQSETLYTFPDGTVWTSTLSLWCRDKKGNWKCNYFFKHSESHNYVFRFNTMFLIMALRDPEHVRMKTNPIQSIKTFNTGPDPGFLAGGAPTYKFSSKLHEIKKIFNVQK